MKATTSPFSALLHLKVIKRDSFVGTPDKFSKLCFKLFKYLSVQVFLSIPEDDLSPIDSQDIPVEGPDSSIKIVFKSHDNENYIDLSKVISHDEVIIGSKDGENFTYLLNIEETKKLKSDTVGVYSLSDDPQNLVHIEFLSKYMCRS